VHDPDFRVAFQDFTTFTEKVSDKVIEADSTIPELPVKDVVGAHAHNIAYRPNVMPRSIEYTEVGIFKCLNVRAALTEPKDIRFSKDPTPYKVRRRPICWSMGIHA
jgi:hypothetical protein